MKAHAKVYCGEAIHVLKKRGRKEARRMHWKPTGPLVFVGGGGAVPVSTRGFKPSAKEASRVVHFGAGGLSARIFVGLNVERKTVWTIEEVIEAFRAVRESQMAGQDASFIAQQGTYTQEGVGFVDEPSVQIIVIDTSGTDPDVWDRQMRELGSAMRTRFEQDSVIVEIQDRGVVQAVYGVTA